MVSQFTFDSARAQTFSPLLEAAVRLAAQGHHHQFRKRAPRDSCCEDLTAGPLPADCVPYITHPMGCMCILARVGAREEVLAAALLHDYLEDVPDPNGRETIRAAVGDDVLELVLAVTEDKLPDVDDSESWGLRKRQQIDRIAAMPDEAVLIRAADMLHNVHSLLADLTGADRQQNVWQRLNAGPDRQLWFFEGVLEAARKRLPRHPLISELEGAIDRLRVKIAD